MRKSINLKHMCDGVHLGIGILRKKRGRIEVEKILCLFIFLRVGGGNLCDLAFCCVKTSTVKHF